jgi:hypothetical protein
VGTLNWRFCDKDGEFTDHDVGFQVDTAGNIVDKKGQLKIKACQECETAFEPSIKKIEMKQEVKIFKCKNCKFESPSADQALTHNIENQKHKLIISKKDRVVGFKKQLEGTAIINQSEDDYSIKCKECNAID